MATEQKGEDDQQVTSTTAFGLRGMVEQYRKIKENAETYPYVWGSYIVVFGGFALWGAYRWRKLRRTEDRVRVLQERLRLWKWKSQRALRNQLRRLHQLLIKPPNS